VQKKNVAVADCLLRRISLLKYIYIGKKALNAGYVVLKRTMGGDAAVIDGARICYQSEGGSPESDKALIKYLIRNNHTSPFEHCTMTFEVKLPLFVRDQWVRHRIGMSYNIKSLRYCEANPEFFVPSEFEIDSLGYDTWIINSKDSFVLYKWWVDYFKIKGFNPGRARELARTKLPTEIYTEMLVTMNAASLMHFLDLRDTNHAQPEIQAYAQALLECAKKIAPITFNTYEELKKQPIKPALVNPGTYYSEQFEQVKLFN
jgi:thymidylate synthase (FAD)